MTSGTLNGGDMFPNPAFGTICLAWICLHLIHQLQAVIPLFLYLLNDTNGSTIGSYSDILLQSMPFF